MSAGKGDRPRAVNGDVYRRNYDRIFRRDNGSDFDYPEGSKTKEQRLAAMMYGEEMMRTRKPYPAWICDECGRLHGRRPDGNMYGATYHIGECGVCGTGGVEVTECRDFGHLKEGWSK